MSSDKNKKKKRKNAKKINYKIIFLAILIVAVLTILGFIISNAITKKQYYGCTEYTMSYETSTSNMMDSYEYYRLYFDNNKGTFYLEYRIVDVDKVYTEEGTFTITSKTINGEKTNVLTLSYDSFADEITGDPVYYETAKNTWTRDQTVTLSETSTFEVCQTFVKGEK